MPPISLKVSDIQIISVNTSSIVERTNIQFNLIFFTSSDHCGCSEEALLV